MSAHGTIVAGAGMSGLSCAMELLRQGEDVLVLDGAAEPGGLVRTAAQDGFLLELGPNTVRPNPELMRLIGEVGLSGEVRLASPRLPRYIASRGKLRKAPLAAISPLGLARIAAEALVPRGGAEGESLYDFVARRFGRAAARDLLVPFVYGIYAADARELLAAAAFPRLVELERRHGSVLRGALAERRAGGPGGVLREKAPRGLLSFTGGLSMLPRAIGARLAGRLRLSARIERVAPGPGGWTVRAGGVDYTGRRLVLALAARDAAPLCAPFAPEAARALSECRSAGVRVVHCAWDRGDVGHDLRGFGYLVRPDSAGPRAEGAPPAVLGSVWSSSLFPGRAPEGKVLLTFFLSPGAVEERDVPGLVFQAARAPLALSREPSVLRQTFYGGAIPIYGPAHLRMAATLEEAERTLPGLFFRGNFRGGTSVGDVVKNAAVHSAA